MKKLILPAILILTTVTSFAMEQENTITIRTKTHPLLCKAFQARSDHTFDKDVLEILQKTKVIWSECINNNSFSPTQTGALLKEIDSLDTQLDARLETIDTESRKRQRSPSPEQPNTKKRKSPVISIELPPIENSPFMYEELNQSVPSLSSSSSSSSSCSLACYPTTAKEKLKKAELSLLEAEEDYLDPQTDSTQQLIHAFQAYEAAKKGVNPLYIPREWQSVKNMYEKERAYSREEFYHEEYRKAKNELEQKKKNYVQHKTNDSTYDVFNAWHKVYVIAKTLNLVLPNTNPHKHWELIARPELVEARKEYQRKLLAQSTSNNRNQIV